MTANIAFIWSRRNSFIYLTVDSISRKLIKTQCQPEHYEARSTDVYNVYAAHAYTPTAQ